jgi:hypothetical protein
VYTFDDAKYLVGKPLCFVERVSFNAELPQDAGEQASADVLGAVIGNRRLRVRGGIAPQLVTTRAKSGGLAAQPLQLAGRVAVGHAVTATCVISGNDDIGRIVAGNGSPSARSEAIIAPATDGARLRTSSAVSPATSRPGRSGMKHV